MLKHPIVVIGFLFVIVALVGLQTLYSLRMDICETFFMGKEFVLSYPKHPFVSFWIDGIFLKVIPAKSLPAFSMCFSCFLYFIITTYTWIFSKKFFYSNEKILRVLVTFGIAISFIFKRVELTPDLFFITFATFFIGSTYNFITKQTTLSYLVTIFFGWLLIFTKYQAFIIFVCAFLPFIFTKEGRNVLLTKKSLVFGIIFVAPIIIYFTYAVHQHFSSLYYATYGKPNFNYLKPLEVITNYFWKYNMLSFLLILFVPSVRSHVKPVCINSFRLIKIQNLKIIFLLSNSIIFLVFAMAFIYIFKPDGLSRYLYSNIVFIQIFTVYFLKEALLFIDKKKLSNIIIIIIIVCFVRNTLSDVRKNMSNLATAYQNMAKYIEAQTGNNFTTLVQTGRNFDQSYPYFTNKPYMIDNDTVSTETKTRLLTKNFIIIWIPNEHGTVPEFVNKYKQEFVHYKQTTYPSFYQDANKTFKWQKSYQVNAEFMLFSAPKG